MDHHHHLLLLILLAGSLVECYVFRRCCLSRSSINRYKATNMIENDNKKRFWLEEFPLNVTVSSKYEPTQILSLIGFNASRINKIETGVILYGGDTLIPVNDGMVQFQYTTKLPSMKEDTAIVCSFAPRASHVIVSPNEEERPLNVTRRDALNDALLKLTSTTPDELLSESLAGTSASRIYRSFVAPRPKVIHILEPLERAANRCATQIELALRQMRADQAAISYLRNTDRSNEEVGPQHHTAREVHPVVLVLDNIRSAFNVGSIFRTAETAGVQELITVGITAHPPNQKLRKTAFTSVDVVPTRHFENINDAIKDLKDKGYCIIALETTSRSVMYTDIKYSSKTALIVGNEVSGVDTRVMDLADYIAEIPTYGVKNSLNVASALPIVLFEFIRQYHLK